MPGISDTIARLAKLRAIAALGDGPGQDAGRLSDLTGFGSNPGALEARLYVPDNLADDAPLVVVLHGCTQTASGYDVGAGWSQLADRYGFLLLFPEQQRQNNPNLCFNWFSPDDNRRDKGEALSIRQMIAAMVDRHDIDPARIFVTGLSAGGAMAAVMLASYPELFAGGAIIAGLPYGSANSIPQAFEAMRGQATPGAEKLADLIRAASDHAGEWPTISIWHGSADATVNAANATALVGQWRALHRVGADPARSETVAGYSHRVWCDDRGRDVIEEYRIAGMGHGTPLDTSGADGCGKSGPFMLEAGVSSTRRICAFWGISAKAEGTKRAAGRPLAPCDDAHVSRATPRLIPVTATNVERPGTPRSASGVGKVIEDALRAAGLMR